MKIKFKWKLFSELTTDELYAIIHLRQKVFIVEQDCPYIDADYTDQKAYHLLAFIDGVLIGYLRAFKPGFKYLEASIGRIIIASKYRKEGLGKKITKRGISFLFKKFPRNNIVISAQYRLLDFYKNLGFIERGDVYLEDNIDHIEMCLECPKR
jgi:ElaA protein|tara:strand:+ start:778 stop:1236 length:459 start_codon:yes stop_codon:yes gene_type:complete